MELTQEISSRFNPLKAQIHFEGVNRYDLFLKKLLNLYHIPFYKSGLDLILTKSFEKKVNFDIKIIKDWDTNVGCYLTEKKKIYNKIIGTFTHILDHKIIIRKLSENVIAHEVSHFVEIESGIMLDQNFKNAMITDLSNNSTGNIALKAEINRLFIEQVKPYPQNQIISEFFARFFEIYAISKELSTISAFSIAEIDNYFVNTRNWIKNDFYPKIRSKINQNISRTTFDLINDPNFKQTHKFTDKTESFYKRVDNTGKKTWSANVGSNAEWEGKFNKRPK
ncbi:MAG: hypothetical protein ACI9W5_000011 [Ulvibacter sp.]|jgi:hypothetical protein